MKCCGVSINDTTTCYFSTLWASLIQNVVPSRRWQAKFLFACAFKDLRAQRSWLVRVYLFANSHEQRSCV